MFITPVILLALSASTLATVFTTNPVASSVLTGGQEATISWQESEDGLPPSLEDFGPASVSIYVGNAQQQTLLQIITDDVDVSEIQAITFTPDSSIGPNCGEYFIRFESLNLKDPQAPQYPALAFSAKFTMGGMTGTFSKEIQDQIDGQSTAPLVIPGQATTVAPFAAATTIKGPTTTNIAANIKATTTKSGVVATNTNAATNINRRWFRFSGLTGAIIIAMIV